MKTVIVGMNNPYSTEGALALYPYPENSAGARLCAMFLEACRRNNDEGYKINYIRGFARMNLVNAPSYSTVSAASAGMRLRQELLGRRVIICGVSVLAAFKLKRKDWMVWSEDGPFDYVLIPHPSGRCREYNDPTVSRAVGDLLYKEWKQHGNPRS